MSKIDVRYRVLDDRLRDTPPKYASDGSAGLDLRACITDPVTIEPGEVVMVRTGMAVHLESPGVVGIITPRSGLGMRGLVLANTVGVIDSDYIGPILLALWNRGDAPMVVAPMDRVAQLLIVPVMQATMFEVVDFHPTARGEGGFGSTGAA